MFIVASKIHDIISLLTTLCLSMIQKFFAVSCDRLRIETAKNVHYRQIKMKNSCIFSHFMKHEKLFSLQLVRVFFTLRTSRTTTVIDVRVVSLNHRAPKQQEETTRKLRLRVFSSQRAFLEWRSAPAVAQLQSGRVRRDHHSTELNTTTVNLWLNLT